MDRLNVPEDMPIEAKMVSKAIQRAQRQIEQQNFEIRKNVLKYDEVLNTQRKVVYEERRKLLEGEDFSEQAIEFVENVITAIVDTYCPEGTFEEEWDVDGLVTALTEVYPTAKTAESLKELQYAELIEEVLEEANDAYRTKEADLGPEMMRRGERIVFLHVIDTAWREHLQEMDYLQEGIGLRAMGQRDPLVEYQREGFGLYQSMLSRIQEDFAKYIFHVQKAAEAEQQTDTRRTHGLRYVSPAKTSEGAARQQAAQQESAGQGAPAGTTTEVEYATIRHEEPKVGRNDPCPCGSGRKYKKCHGAHL
jgi:preprotein translocase subunit SecA